MPQITLNVEARVTSIRIEATEPPQLYLEGVVVDLDRGELAIRTFGENVQGLSPTQLDHLRAIRDRAQQWVDNKLATT